MFTRLNKYKHPVLLFSAGLDSSLLLAMLIEAKAQFDIVTFGREFWTREQKYRADSQIRRHNLKVFSYPPVRTSFIGDGEQISLVREYAFMGATMPLVSDVIEGTRCIADLDSHKASAPPFQWDCVLIGSRQDDKHYAFEDQVIPDFLWTVGATTFYAPFYDRSRDWVKAELTLRGMDADEVEDKADSGNVSLCSLCLDTTKDAVTCPKENSLIPTVRWDGLANLQAFRSVYGATAK